MGRPVVYLVAVLFVLGPLVSFSTVGLPAAGTLGADPGAAARPDQAPAREGGIEATPTPRMEPGAQFGGVIGAHRERHEGLVTARAVEVRLSRAGSPTEKAETIAAIYHRTSDRLDELARERQNLTQAYGNGTLNASEFRARVAVLDVKVRSVERVAARLEIAAEDLSLAVLESAGVRLAAIRDLRARAEDLQGPQLEAIAPSFERSATGDDDGLLAGTETVTTPTEPGGVTTETPNASAVVSDAEAEVQRARERVAEANRTIDSTLATDAVLDLLEQARANLSVAEHRLADARDALEAGDESRAIDLANEAIEYARTAIAKAEAALEEYTV